MQRKNRPHPDLKQCLGIEYDLYCTSSQDPAVCIFRCYCRLYNPTVIGKQKLQNHFPVFLKSFSVCFYTHARSGRGGTCSIQSAPFIFNHAHTAGTVNRQFGMVTNVGSLMPAFRISSRRFFSPFISTGIPSINIYSLLSISSALQYCVECTSFNTCTALDTFALIYNKRLFNFSCYCAHRTTSCTLWAAFAQRSINSNGFKLLTISCGTSLVINMCFIFFSKILNRTYNRKCRSFAKSASAVAEMVSANSKRSSMSPSWPFPSTILSKISSILFVPSRQGTHFPQDSFWVKFIKSAQLLPYKYCCPLQPILRNQSWHQLFQWVKIQWKIQIFFRQAPSRRASDLHGFKIRAIPHSSADVKYNFPQGCSHGNLNKTGIFYVARQRKSFVPGLFSVPMDLYQSAPFW